MSEQQRQRIQAVGHVSAKPIGSVLQPDGLSPSGIDQLYQQGSARIRFPATAPGALHAVLINTAGGLTGDDSIQWVADASARAHLCVSTAACEKVYRTHGPAARQKTRLGVAAQGRLEWLPQETIVFNGASLHRTLDLQLQESSEALICESLVLGRQAMQERMDNMTIRDRWRIRRGERLLHAEDLYLRIEPPIRPAPVPLSRDKNNKNNEAGSTTAHNHLVTDSLLKNYRAISTLVLVSQRPAEWLGTIAQRIRALCDTNIEHIRIGASVLPHRLVVRVLASDSFQLRRFLIPCISLLNDGRSVPTVWKV